VIGISHKPSFPAGHLLQLAFGRAGAFGLQLFSKMGISCPPILDLPGVVKRVIRADCNIHYPAIYSKNAEIGNLLGIAMLKRYMQVEHSVSAIIRDCGGLDGPAKIVSVMRWNRECSFDSAFCRSNRGNSMHKIHGKDSLVVSHCRERLMFWKHFTFDSFQSFASTVSCSLYQRRRKVRDALTSKLVGCIMIIYPITGLILVSPFRGYRECFRVGSHCIEKSPAILVCQPELECCCPEHIIYARI